MIKRQTFYILAVISLFFLSPYFCFALPSDASVESGSASFESPNANTLNIQASDKAVINFGSFSIAKDQTVNVATSAPAVNPSMLFRDEGGSASFINGNLLAPGITLFLVNTAGIYIGPDGNIQANNFIASTLDISTNNFIHQQYIFEHDPAKIYAQILNKGNITANNVSLIASAVDNQGIILARAGTINLASGDKTTVSFDSKGLLQVEVTEETSGEVISLEDGKTLDSAIANSGTLEAQYVILTAKTARDIFEYAINCSGIIRATGLLIDEDGTIKIVANHKIKLEGTLEVPQGNIVVKAPEVQATLTTPLTFTYWQDADIMHLTNSTLTDGTITLEGLGVFLIYPQTSNLTLRSNNTITTEAGVILQANTVRLLSNKFGTTENPITILSPNTYIQRLSGNIDIFYSQLQGDQVLLRGPPDLSSEALAQEDGFGAITYLSTTHLTLEAQNGDISVTQGCIISTNSLTLLANTIVNAGSLLANATDYATAGNIRVIAQQTLTLETTSLIEAKGKDVLSNGGIIYLYSYGNAYALGNQTIDVSGGTVSGNGGNAEFSAKYHAAFSGTINGYASAGFKRGNFIMDPETASVSGTYAANTTVWATGNITIDGATTINNGVTLNIFADHSSATEGDWHDGTGTITVTGAYTIAAANFATVYLNLKAGSGVGTSGAPILTNNTMATLYLEAQINPAGSGGIYVTNSGLGLALNDAVSVPGSGAITLSSTTANVGALYISNQTVSSVSGTITLICDTIDLGTIANKITTTGAIILKPYTQARTKGIGGIAPTGDFNLTATEILSLTSGYSSLTIGTSGDSLAVDIDVVSFTGAITIYGGATTLDGTLKTLKDGGAAITINTGTAALVTGNNIIQSRNAADSANDAGTITLICDTIDLGTTADKITTTGQVWLKPYTANRTINISTSIPFGFFDLTPEEVEAVNNTCSKLTIGNVSGATGGSVNLYADIYDFVSLEILGNSIAIGASGALTTSNNTALDLDGGSIIIYSDINMGSGAVTLNFDSTITNLMGSSTITTNSASGLIIENATSIGNASWTLKTTVSKLTINSDGDAYITETNSLDLGTINITTDHTLTLVAAGTITQSGAMTAGTFILTNSGGDATLGQANAVTNLGAITVTTGAFSFSNGNNNLTLTGTVKTRYGIDGTGKPITINTGTGALDTNDQYIQSRNAADTANANGPITLICDTIDLGTTADKITTTGAIILKPYTTSRTVGIGVYAPGTFHLSIAEIAVLTGYSSLTIGADGNTGTVSIFDDVDLIIEGDFSVYGGDIYMDNVLNTSAYNGDITFDAGVYSFTNSYSISAGAGTITIIADSIGFGDSITTTGNIILRPHTPLTTIGIGGGAGTFNLNEAALPMITSGYSLLTIGASDSGAVDINNVTFAGNTAIYGGAMALETITTNNLAVTLTSQGAITDSNAGTSNFTLGSGVLSISANGNIGASDNYLDVNTTGQINLSTLDFFESIYLNSIVAGVTDLGTVTVANGMDGHFYITSTGGVSQSGVINAHWFTITSGGSVDLSTQNNLIDSIYSNSSVAGDFSLKNGNNLFYMLGALDTSSANGNITLNVGTNYIDTLDNAITAGSGTITLIADTIYLGTTADKISTTGSIILKPYTTSRTVGIGNGATGSFNLDVAAIATLTGYSSLTIGASGNTGAVDINNITFEGNTTIYGGAMTVDKITTASKAVTLNATGTVTDSNAGADNFVLVSGALSITTTSEVGGIGVSATYVYNPLEVNTTGTINLATPNGWGFGDGDIYITSTTTGTTTLGTINAAVGGGFFSITSTYAIIQTGTITSLGLGVTTTNGNVTLSGNNEVWMLGDCSIAGNFTLSNSSTVPLGFIAGGDISTTGLAGRDITLTSGTYGASGFSMGPGTSISAGTGNITIIADIIALNTTADTITTTGAIVLKPVTTTSAETIGIGGTNPTGVFQLTAVEIATLTGYNSLTIATSANAGAVDIDNVTFSGATNNATITVYGGAMALETITKPSGVDGINIILNAKGAVTDANAGTDNFALGTGTLTISTTSGNIGAYDDYIDTSTTGQINLSCSEFAASIYLNTTGASTNLGTISPGFWNDACRITTVGNVTQNGIITAHYFKIISTGGGVNLSTQDNHIDSLESSSAAGNFAFNNGNTNITVNALDTSAADGDITIDCGTGTLTKGNAYSVSAGSGDITLICDTIDLGTTADKITTTGLVWLKPYTANRAINISTTSGSSGFDLSTAEVEVINNTCSKLTIGNVSGASGGAVNMYADVYDFVSLEILGNGITVYGTLTTSNNTALDLDCGSIYFRADVNMGSGSVTLNSDGTIENRDGLYTITTTSTSGLIIENATSIGLSGSTSLRTAISKLTINSDGDAMIIETDGLDLGTINITSGHTFTLTTAGPITQSGVMTANTLILTNTNGSTTLEQANVVTNLGAVTVTGGAFSFSNGNNNLTLTGTVKTKKDGGAAITISTGTGALDTNDQIIQSRNAADTANASGTITLICDTIDLGTTADKITTTGTVWLKPYTANRNILISGGPDHWFEVSESELEVVNNTCSKLTIGNVSGATGGNVFLYGDIYDFASLEILGNSINPGYTGGALTTSNNTALDLDGGSITFNYGGINMGSGAITLNSDGAITNLDGSSTITTTSVSGLTIENATTIGASDAVLKTTVFKLTINSDGDAYINETDGLDLGTINITTGHTFSLTAAGTITQSGVMTANILNLTNTSGSTTLNQANVISNVCAVTSTGGNFSLTNTRALGLANNTFNAGGNAIAINNGDNEITIVTFYNITAGNLTLTASTITNLDAATLSLSGALVMQPSLIYSTIGLGGTTVAGTFNLIATEIAKIKASGATSITIGTAGGSGVLTLGAAVDLAGKTVIINSGNINDSTNAISARNLTLNLNSALANTVKTTISDTLYADTTAGSNKDLAVTFNGTILGTINVGSGTFMINDQTNDTLSQSGPITAGTLVLTHSAFQSDTLLDNESNAISVLGTINCGDNIFILVDNIAGGITQTGVMTADTFALTNTAGSTILTQNNVITNLGAVTATGGNFVLTNSTALTIAGNLNAMARTVTLTISGNLYGTTGCTITATTLNITANGYDIGKSGSQALLVAVTNDMSITDDHPNICITNANASDVPLTIGTMTNTSATNIDYNKTLALGALTISGGALTIGGTYTPSTLNINGAILATGQNIIITAAVLSTGVSGSITTQTSGNVTFITSSASTLRSLISAGSLTFVSGTWTLNDALSVAANFTLSSGAISAGSNTITVGANWSNLGTFTANTSTVTFDGSSASIISGNTTFYNLTSATAGKTLTFTAGTTQIISHNLTLTGTASSPIIINSTGLGTQPALNLSSGATQSITNVEVTNNNASGLQFVARGTASSLTNTTNWILQSSGTTYTWTGSVSTDWNDPLNWDLGIVPSTTDTVIIPDVSNQPAISSEVELQTLVLDAGEILTISPGGSLTMGGDTTLNGILDLGSSTFTSLGNIATSGTGVLEGINPTLDVSGTIGTLADPILTTVTGTLTLHAASLFNYVSISVSGTGTYQVIEPVCGFVFFNGAMQQNIGQEDFRQNLITGESPLYVGVPTPTPSVSMPTPTIFSFSMNNILGLGVTLPLPAMKPEDFKKFISKTY